MSFEDAVSEVKNLTNVSNSDKLRIYGCYKVATTGEGPSTAQPSSWDPVKRKKWDAWKETAERLKGDKEAAKPTIASLTAANAALKAALAKYESGVLKHPSCTSFSKNYHKSSNTPAPHPVTVKSGYLNKWKDRAIGWTGSKWGVRYITLTSDGTLKYSASHSDNAPRATLSLKRCAVKDDGHKSTKSSRFHVFSIYRREKGAGSNPSDDVEDDIVPLMRFSTTSKADKESWMAYLTEGCASFAPPPLEPIPKGTLSPIYFSNPSISPNMSMYAKKSTDPKAAHTKQRNIATYQPSRPMHRNAKPSFLSEGGGNQNYRGLLNLAAIILIVSNFRLIYDTMKKHGFLISIPNKDEFMSAPLKDFPAHTGTLLLNLHILFAYFIEKHLLSAGRIPETLGLVLHHLNASLSLVIPTYIVWVFEPNPSAGGGLLMCSVILWMKLISYFHANSDYRSSGPDKTTTLNAALVTDVDEEDALLQYPSNLTLQNIYYFWFAPTLTYQIAFPKAKHGVRPLYVAGLVVRMSITAALFVFLVKQTINPTVEKLVGEIQRGNLNPVIAAESLVKLAIPNTYVWLLVFYFYFHLFLNLLAELLRFGDRVFYKDWWNCTEIGSYWRLWNLPVHFWLIRHLYMPSIRWKVPSVAATGLVFLFSAVLHEFIISVPFHMVRYWSFLGMMAQIPLVFVTKWLDKKFKGSSVGNVVFWLVFCVVGQPCAILLYAIDHAQLTNKGGEQGEVEVDSGVGMGEL
ncbi:hypothetical protein TrCOL_g722 [Triparma columacea]|uniref:diacylglycerol O-acyltransferase n=1 Tax=Triparma columacea TaxID=722753 RepID=A0A9W7G4X6_9STRA|nr:hypothetical protein TrCOL_g722 [Triparma columacea]